MTYLEQMRAIMTRTLNDYASQVRNHYYYLAGAHKRELKWLDRQIRKEERRLRRKK